VDELMLWYDADAKRHEANAAKWLALGNAEYAEGSMRKAQRFRQRARQLDMLRHGPYPKTQLQQLVSDRVDRITNDIAHDFERLLFG
jgi:hypothetical protein